MIGALRQRVEESFRSFGRVFGNPDIRKIELAWSGWVLGHWAYGIALAVYAYEQGGAPAVGLVGWELTLVQQFQFGDLRVETPRATVVVELESAGGVGNLVKYWPLLAGGELPKRLLLIHVFQIGSAGDYIAHRRLWGFVVERMREDLERRGVSYPDAWEGAPVHVPERGGGRRGGRLPA